MAPKFVKRDSHGNLARTCMTLDISAWMMEVAMAEHGDLYINNENGRAGRATEVEFNGPTGQALFQWWHDMIKEGLAINVGRNPSGADSLLAIGTGQAVMTWGGSAALRSVVDVLEGGLSQIEVDLGPPSCRVCPAAPRYAGTFSRGLWCRKIAPRRSRRRHGSSSSGSWSPSSRPSGSPAAATCPYATPPTTCPPPRRSWPSTPSSARLWTPSGRRRRRRPPSAPCWGPSPRSGRGDPRPGGDVVSQQGPHRGAQRRGRRGEQDHRRVQPARPVGSAPRKK